MRVRRTRTRRGAAAVELAALLPFLMYLCIIATDWARLLYYTISIQACARAGALYAADVQTAAVSPYASVAEAAQAEAPMLATKPTITTTAVTIKGKSGVKVTATLDFKTITNFPGVPKSQTLIRSVEMPTFPVTAD